MYNGRNCHVFIGGLVVLASLLACGAPIEAMPRKASTDCPVGAAVFARVRGVDERLDILLDDGRFVHLAGLDPARPTPDAPERDNEARAVLAQKILGRMIGLVALGDNRDRWGRTPVFGFFSGAAEAEPSIALFLLRTGLARVKPRSEIHPCVKAWLAAEAEARADRRGLWADPYYAVIRAEDNSGFAEKAATDVIVEGKVAAVVPGQFGLRLQFGTGHGRNFSVIILQRNTRIFEQAAMKINSLVGRTIRVRGLLDMRFGPQIEVGSPDELELVKGEENKAQTEVMAKSPETNSSVLPEKP